MPMRKDISHPLHGLKRRAVAGFFFGLLMALPLSGPAQEATVVRGQLGRTLDREVQRATGGGFWGVVLVAQAGKVVLAKGYGFADYQGRPNSPDTLFEIASVSKQFTAAAILKLEMQGKLRLQDPIGKFFEEVPEDKRAITVHHLLTHSSGISPKVGIPYASPYSLEQLAKHVLEPPLSTKPGEAFAYCNFGYALLAAIVEVASGQSFDTYMKEGIFAPAGLSDTGVIRDRSLDSKRVTTRLSERTPDATASSWFWGWGYRGMGGVVSTAVDLLKWDRVLRQNDLFDEAAKKKLYAPCKSGYACGWKVGTTSRGSTKVFHSGGVEGYAAHFVRYLEDDAVIVILSNGKTNIHDLARRIDGLLFPRPAITASLDASAYEFNRFKAAELPSSTAWKVEKEKDGVVLSLRDPRQKHVPATIQIPRGAAKKLLRDLEAMLEQRQRQREPARAEKGMSAGVYLYPYEARDRKVELSSDLEITLMPRYVGRDEKGKTIVDDRITFTLRDSRKGHWPIMVKMSTKVSRRLSRELRRALD